MKLHEVPRNTMIRIKDDNIRVPVGAKAASKEEVIKFHHIDGMYSFCTNHKNEVVHLALWTEVDIVPNGMLD